MTSDAPQSTNNTKTVLTPGPRAGEPPFQMKIEPDKYMLFKWKPEQPIQVEMKIENTTKARQTFKVKCTDNEIFRVSPPLGFINAGETATIMITCTSKTLPENDRHLFAVYHFATEEQNKAARLVWTADAKAEGMTRIVVGFEDGTSGEKEEEKKDDEDAKKKLEKEGGEKKEDMQELEKEGSEKKEMKELEQEGDEKKEDMQELEKEGGKKKEEMKELEKEEMKESKEDEKEEKDEKKEETKDEGKKDKDDDKKKDEKDDQKKEEKDDKKK